jgi:histidyl-tRNA synthetase
VTRLCYCGSVLHTVPAGMTKMREPIQIGAELYGHAGIEADIEIVRLMIEALQRAGIERCTSTWATRRSTARWPRATRPGQRRGALPRRAAEGRRRAQGRSRCSRR